MNDNYYGMQCPHCGAETNVDPALVADSDPMQNSCAADGSLYFSMDSPWGSKEDKEAYKKADEAFNLYKEVYPYVALIRSHHWASHGYWVEIKEKEVKFPDIIEKYHKS